MRPNHSIEGAGQQRSRFWLSVEANAAVACPSCQTLDRIASRVHHPPQMTVPTYDQFIEPILRFLARNPDGALAKFAHDAAASALELTDEDRLQMLASGTQLVYKNRAGWAHDRLKRAGLSSSPKRGFWKLTAEGYSFVKSHPAPLTADVTQKLLVVFFIWPSASSMYRLLMRTQRASLIFSPLWLPRTVMNVTLCR